MPNNNNLRPRLLPGLVLSLILACIFLLSTGAFCYANTERVFGSFNTLARKTAHVSEYALLFIVMRWVASAVVRKRGTLLASLVVFLLCALYAASDEWHQSFVPGRTASTFDVLLDSCGAALGWVVWSLYQRLGSKRFPPS